jgi:L-malate glycosyltransferase
MRVMFITPWYPDEARPNSGIFIRAQALALAQTHNVLVIAFKVNYNQRGLYSCHATRSKSDNLEEYRIEVAQSLPFYNQVNYLLITHNFAVEKAKAFRPDIIHASIGYPGGLLGWSVARKLSVPFVFTEHTKPENNFRSLWHKLTTRFAVQKAAAVMAVGGRLATEMHTQYQTEAIVIPNIVDIEKYEGVTPSTKDLWQLGFIGGMNTPVKGLDILLKACSTIGNPFELHICGAGVLMESYKRLADELGIGSRCIFYGFIHPSQMPTFFSKIHTLICSSRYETFNISLIEAMACGLPVVSTRCGGPEDFVNDRNGILCEPENPETLKDAIIALMTSRARFLPESLRSFAANFSSGVVAAKILGVYATVLERSK